MPPEVMSEQERLTEVLLTREREVAALAAEVERLRMALGCVRVVNGGGSWSSEKKTEIGAICDLALDPAEKGSA